MICPSFFAGFPADCFCGDLYFFFNDPATTEIYTRSLHDALPISQPDWHRALTVGIIAPRHDRPVGLDAKSVRSEEHTSELQSHLNLVCRLLLEKKNKNLIHKQNNNKKIKIEITS